MRAVLRRSKTIVRRVRFLAVFLLLISACTMAQPALHKWHEMPGVCMAGAWIDQVGGGITVDSIVWSNGDTGWIMQNVPIGNYSVEGYLNGVLVYGGPFVLESITWFFPPATSWVNSELVLTGSTYLPYCSGGLVDAPCCEPVDYLTHVELLQDGLLFDQQDYSCAGGAYTFMGLPLGHVYQLRLNDAGCAGMIYQPPITAHNCANLQLDTVVVGSVPGQYMGSITVLDPVPDTTEFMPIYAPVYGTATLYSLPSWNTIGAVQDSVLQASWTGLDTGNYVVGFRPEALCQQWLDTIRVPELLNVGVPAEARPALSIGPSVTKGPLTLRGATGEVQLAIVDAHGRMVDRRVMQPGTFSVEHLTPGLYVILAEQGNEHLRTCFVRQ